MAKRLLAVLMALVLVLGTSGVASAAGPGETGNGTIPPGFTKVTFIHHVSGPPETIVEHGSNGKAPLLSETASVCSDPVNMDGTDLCDSFDWDGQKWSIATVSYNVNLNNSGGDSTFLTAIQDSAQTWSDVSDSDFVLAFDGTTDRKASSLRNRMDNYNDVTWDNLGGRYRNAIAVTIFWYNTNTGEVVEADLINNSRLPWAASGNAPTAYDVQNIVTHEFGHFLVLKDLYDVSDNALTMYGYGEPGKTGKRSLGLGDELGIRAIYGSAPSGNQAPVANAGPDQNVSSGTTVQLDGAGSSDPNVDDTITHSWAIVSLPLGSTAVLTDANTATPTFVADLDGTYAVALTVSDGSLSNTDTVVVTAGVIPVATSVSVDSVGYATEGGRKGDKHLLVTIALVDGSGDPVAGASVSITLYNPDAGLSLPGTGTTGSGGTVTFSLKNAPTGTYTTAVTGVTADGLTWDGITPANEFEK